MSPVTGRTSRGAVDEAAGRVAGRARPPDDQAALGRGGRRYEEAEPKAGFLGRYLDPPGIVATSVDVGDASSGGSQGTDGAG